MHKLMLPHPFSLLQDDADDGEEILDIDCDNVARVMVKVSATVKAQQVAEVQLRQMPKCLMALGVQQSQQNRYASDPVYMCLEAVFLAI